MHIFVEIFKHEHNGKTIQPYCQEFSTYREAIDIYTEYAQVFEMNEIVYSLRIMPDRLEVGWNELLNWLQCGVI